MDSYSDIRRQCCGFGSGSSQAGAGMFPAWDSVWGKDAATYPYYENMPETPDYGWQPRPSAPQDSAQCPDTSARDLEQQHPIAMAYVPWQQWQTPYQPGRGLEQGTIFPALDLPFSYGRCSR